MYTWKINEYDDKGKLIPNWSHENPTKVTAKFEKAGTKGTKVTLVHDGFPGKDEQFYMHETGWDSSGRTGSQSVSGNVSSGVC